MKTSNKIILAFILLSSAGNVILSLMGVQDLAVYYIVSAIALFLVVLFAGELKPSMSQNLVRISTVAFAVFVFLVVFKIVQWMKIT